MSLALAAQSVDHQLRKKKLYVTAVASGSYLNLVTSIATGGFTQPGGAGTPLLFTVIPGTTLSGSATFSTANGTGPGTQAVNLATYAGLTSKTPATATAAAVALAAALTAGTLGTASGSVYTGTVTAGVVSIATNKGAETLSVTVSTVIETDPAGGGDVVNLNAIVAALGMADATVGYPGNITTFSVIGAPPGYVAQLVKGATLAQWRLRIFESGTANAVLNELATGAYPAGITGSSFLFTVEGPKGQI